MARSVESFLGELLRAPDFLARYPYYAAILAKLAPVADPSVEVMGMSLHGGRFYLHVNVEAMAKEPTFVRGVLLHEVHHLVLGHLTDRKYRDVERPDLMQLAQETSANAFIEEPLPSPILWQHFEKQGFRAGQSTMERYALLVKAAAEGESPARRPGTRRVDDHAWAHGPPPPGASEPLKKIVETAIDETNDRLEESTPRAARLVAGRTPERLLEELVGTRRAPDAPLDWKTALRNFVARARAPVHTRSRPNRRFPERVFEVPGRTWQPRAIERPHLLVAIDTSMSMSEAELSEVARQLRPLAEHARLTIAECDVELGRVYPFDGILTHVVGRGGTDLRPPLDPAFLRSRGVDGVVFFTDGAGPYPELPPPVPVLWVLTKPFEFGCPFGSRAQLVRKPVRAAAARGR